MERTHRRVPRARRALVIAVVALLAGASACSRTVDTASDRGGWLDGSPAEADAARIYGEARSEAGSDASSSGAMTADMATSSAAEVAPEPGPAAPVRASGLSAGSVDDNDDFAGYLGYRDRADDLGLAFRPLDVSVRHVVQVDGADGRPVLGEPVEVLAGGAVVGSVRTGPDGRAYVHPRAMGVAPGTAVALRVDGEERAPVADGSTAFVLDRPGGAAAPVALDLFFVLDATGSMGDELDRLTSSVDSVVARIASLDSRPDVRLGMTVYRDEGDAFVTRTFDFTDDVAAFRSALGEVRAAGGGDEPEAMDEAFAASLDEPSWRAPGEAVQLAFVMADAPPQVARPVQKPYDESLREAAARGIRVNAVGASGTSDSAEYVLRQLAQFTGGRFVFLSYGADGAALGPSTDIASVDYEELPLDDLLVRLVAEQLAALTGGDVVVPTTSTTTSTLPQQRQGG